VHELKCRSLLGSFFHVNFYLLGRNLANAVLVAIRTHSDQAERDDDLKWERFSYEMCLFSLVALEKALQNEFEQAPGQAVFDGFVARVWEIYAPSINSEIIRTDHASRRDRYLALWRDDVDAWVFSIHLSATFFEFLQGEASADSQTIFRAVRAAKSQESEDPRIW